MKERLSRHFQMLAGALLIQRIGKIRDPNFWHPSTSDQAMTSKFRFLLIIVIALRWASAHGAPFVAFNDMGPGPGTDANTTTFSVGITGGALTNITDGAPTGA